MIKTGIYYIQNIDNGKMYIGSAVYITDRWRVHKFHLRKGDHPNIYLQSTWNKNGEDVFIFGIIEETNRETLLEREQYWIDFYNTCDREVGYNLAPVAGSMLGYRHTEETKEKLRKAGFPKRHIPWNKGKKMTGEYKENHAKASAKRKGVPSTRKNFTHSEESRKKISEAGKGRACSDETRKKHSIANTGKKLKMPEGWRDNMKKVWVKRKLNGKIGWDTRRKNNKKQGGLSYGAEA